MRLRNIPGSREIIASEGFVIKEPETLKGRWQTLFNNNNDIHIEIGMGKGAFITSLAVKNPDINYIGIEKYSSVLLRAVEKRRETELNNLVFIRFDADFITNIFSKNEISRIYLNFSDPWPKDRHSKRRLTSKQFLKRYEEFLEPDGTAEFKTDNKSLLEFSLEQAEEAGWKVKDVTYDLHNSRYMEDNIMTEYEERFSSMGSAICRVVIYRG